MSTSIVRTYTTEGFVVAADGRARDAGNRTVASDQVQKIFPIGGGEIQTAAYSISGTAFIGLDDGSDVMFDLQQQMKSATQVYSMRRAGTVLDYAERVCSTVHQSLAKAKLAGQLDYPESNSLDASEPGATIARILFDGYCKGIPTRVKARLFHRDQVLAPLEVLQQELAPGCPWCQGPEQLTDMMWGSAKKGNFMIPYEKRAVELVRHPNETLRIHAQMAHAYISACSDPEVIAVDPEQCAGIGGRIHIATIDPKTGFRWIPGFAPKAAGSMPRALSTASRDRCSQR